MIASGMGLTKAAVTYHFSTKEDLFNAVVEPAFTDLNAYFEKWEPGPLEPARRSPTAWHSWSNTAPSSRSWPRKATAGTTSP